MRRPAGSDHRYSPFCHLGSVLRKHRPIHLTLFVTRRCNARCPFCFYLSGTERQGGHTEELSLEEYTKLSLSMGSLLWLAFSGGEIFLRQDLALIAKQFYRRNRPAIILLPTNGLLPDRICRTTEEILGSCPKSTVVVKVSIDGEAAVHDRLRGVDGAAAKAMQTFDALRALKKRFANLELGINSVFCAANQNCMESLIDEVITLQWASVGILRENESYAVTVEDITEGQGRKLIEYVSDTKFIVPRSFRANDSVPHIYRWWVVAVRQAGTDEDGNPVWEPAGAISAARVFTWLSLVSTGTQTP